MNLGSRFLLPVGQVRRSRSVGAPARARGSLLSATPGPMAKSGLKPASDPQHPSLLAAAWVGACALGVGLLACLFTLANLQTRLELLHQELSQLRGELKVMVADRGDPDAQQSPSNVLVPPLPQLRPPVFMERKRRDVVKTPHRHGRQRKKRWEEKKQAEEKRREMELWEAPPGKQSVLHLVPSRHTKNGEGDSTDIWWEPFLQQGGALEPRGREVVVKHTGLYFVYSQVLFHDPMFTMGQVLLRMSVGSPDQILFRCVQSMPSDPEKAYNSCYSGGVFHLQQGDRLNLHIPRFNASFDASAHGTFLGLLRL